ncbi:MAG: CrcB family protein [Gammaproteobacteria bacterium]|nr:CrcB family protein [Gammaproteobacteria bacterium]MBS8267651.1 CrcB family protein [Halomonas litopenaei]
MEWWTLAAVALGGAAGGMGRMFVSRRAAAAWGVRFPWGTLIVNLLGALVIGLLASRLVAGSTAALMLLSGVMGGFTTVSSFSLQTLDLMREGRHAAAALNVSLTLLAGLAAVVAGLALGGGL